MEIPLAVCGIQTDNPQELGQSVYVFINQEIYLGERHWPQQSWLTNVPGYINGKHVHGLARFETSMKIDRNTIQVYSADCSMREAMGLNDVLDRGVAVWIEQEFGSWQ